MHSEKKHTPTLPSIRPQGLGKTVVIGLTGSIGMGKTTISNMFRAENVPVFCADSCVKDLRQRPEIQQKIGDLFPAASNKKGGKEGIDVAKLRALLQKKPEKVHVLEAVFHPLVRAGIGQFLRQNGRAPVVVVDIPLLFEGGLEAVCDLTVVVTAPDFIQEQRVLARPSMTKAYFEKIKALQMPDGDKRTRADFVIPTSQGRRYSLECVQHILDEIV